jgi:hypothetical protein
MSPITWADGKRRRVVHESRWTGGVCPSLFLDAVRRDTGRGTDEEWPVTLSAQIA